ncbi:ABC-2 type transport system permease protein [Kitasatospora sp. SolWspMP-SS2h]|uniref:ABC transporter permease n=1 Tax=Kitasatospora sp. SolWspMP-SS2h TaxID=1305729 RepID=UPI000DB91BD7|nr:ABC transporter permease [Kitasatospora sp. SolWspMP-SS2h]RAJ29646.1 ABC-2 type transport system permease protein [Kitasatospora sp. SolWspMP-SS2h]
MNTTVARLTARGLFGRRRVLVLLAVPVLLLVLAVIARNSTLDELALAHSVLGSLALGTLVPITGLIVGTGVIATEIEDGSIVYLLAKPLPRWKIVTTKLAVAVASTWLLSAVPTYVAGLVLYGPGDGVALGYGVGALAAGAAYSALFLLLGVLTRHAVIAGLAYALIWESLIGNYVEGARTLSVQQWGLALTEAVAADGTVTAPVGLTTAVWLLVVVAAGATAAASVKLAGLTLGSEE